MQKTIFLLIFIVFFSNCSTKTVKIDNLTVFKNIESLSEYLSKKIIENDKQRGNLKIVFFPIINEEKQFRLLGYLINNQIKTDLFNEKRYDILERVQLEYVLEELQLSASDLFSQENIEKIGKFAGANAVLVGDIVDMGKYFNINIQLVSVEQAKVISIATAKLLTETYKKQYETNYSFNTSYSSSTKTKFSLTIKSAEILVSMDENSSPDTYGYIIDSSGKSFYLSKVQDSYKPEWNTNLDIELTDDKPLTIKLIDKDAMTDDIITTFIIQKKAILSKLDKNGDFMFEDARAKIFLNFAKIK